MQKVIVIDDGIGRVAAASEVLARLGLEVMVVGINEINEVTRTPEIFAIKAPEITPYFDLFIKHQDRHMKNSPYPAKNRGKGKRNKY